MIDKIKRGLARCLMYSGIKLIGMLYICLVALMVSIFIPPYMDWALSYKGTISTVMQITAGVMMLWAMFACILMCVLCFRSIYEMETWLEVE